MSIDLVTGASGLVGGNLTRVLISKGRKVRILARKNSKTSHLDGLKGVEKVYGDITDLPSLLKACDGVENVYHCAAMVSMWHKHEMAMYIANVVGTDNIIETVKTACNRRLIYCSSVDAIGLKPDGSPSNENTAWNWDKLGVDNPYARTKYQAQQIVLQAAKSEIDAVIVNPTYMFGAYDTKPSSGQMIISAIKGQLRAYPAGGNNFVDVLDVANAMITAADKGKRGEFYIVGNKNISYKEIFNTIARILKVAPPRIPIPYNIARLGGWIGDTYGLLSGKEPKINSVTTKLGFINHFYDSAKGIAELGIKYNPVELAIERAAEWFFKQRMI